MKRILVIGEHSYIGISFRDYMAKKEPDCSVTLAGARNGAWKREDLSGYDAVLHAAAIVHKKERPAMKRFYDEVNAALPQEVAKQAKRSGVKCFIFLSTMAVYGEEKGVMGSNSPVSPVTMYGESKLEAEKGLERLSDDGFHVVIFRPPMVYGRGCPGNYARLAKLAKAVPVFPKVKNQRSMIYIENLCECIWKSAQKTEKKFEVICPQNAEYVNTAELVRQIRNAYGKKTWLLPAPMRLVRLLAKRIGMAQKVFGDCCYEKRKEDQAYQVAGFAESVRKTEIGKCALVTATVASMIDLFNMDNISILQEMGYEVEVAANFESGNVTSAERLKVFQRELQDKGIRYYQVPIPRSIAKIGSIWKSYRQLRALCRKNRYQAVHTQTPIGGAITRLAARKLRKTGSKVIYMAHGFHFYEGAPKKNWLLFYPIEKYLSKCTDILITINHEDYDRAKEFYAKEVYYVPGVGVDLEKFAKQPDGRQRVRKSAGIAEDDFAIVSVGELSKRKNQETIIRALAQIPDRHVKYLLVGQGSEEQKDRRLAEELGVAKRVVFAGYCKDVREMLQAADCFVFPSLQEGLPVALMEAMAFGLPVICSRIRGNTDLVTDGAQGRLVEPMDASGYAAAVMEMKNNPRMAKSYALLAHEKIKEFCKEKAHERMKAIYKECNFRR